MPLRVCDETLFRFNGIKNIEPPAASSSNDDEEDLSKEEQERLDLDFKDPTFSGRKEWAGGLRRRPEPRVVECWRGCTRRGDRRAEMFTCFSPTLLARLGPIFAAKHLSSLPWLSDSEAIYYFWRRLELKFFSSSFALSVILIMMIINMILGGLGNNKLYI